MKKTVFLIICSLASVALLAGGAWGAEWVVSCVDIEEGGDYTDLQAALTDAETGAAPDRIKVAQGTYSGNFTYDSSAGYAIELLGGYVPGTGCAVRELDPSNTVLDGGGTGRVLELRNTNGGGVTVEGFTIWNGNTIIADDGSGLLAESSSETGDSGSVTIRHNTITGNNSPGVVGHGGGVWAHSSSDSGTAGNITLLNNTIAGNNAGFMGGVSALSDGATASGTVTIQGNTITGNTAYDFGGGSVGSYSEAGTAGAVTLLNNTITGNIADRAGGGVSVGSSTDTGTAGAVTLLNNTITENNAEFWGGVKASSYADTTGTTGPVTFVNNIIAGNYTSGGMGGAYAYSFSYSGTSSGAVTFTNNTVTENTADSDIGGVHLQSTHNNAYVYNNIIRGNTSPDITVDVVTAYGYNNDYTTLDGTWDNSGGNIDIDPLFVGGGDYHLQLASECLDAGTVDAPELPATDFEGENRIIGPAPDIGADEYLLLYAILHKEGAIWAAGSGWIVTTPPYYPGTDYARALELRDDYSYVILHKDGAFYDSTTGWDYTAYFADTDYAVDVEISPYGVILHRDGALGVYGGGWITTSPPYYPGTDYARDLEVDGSRYVILHKEGSVYDSDTGWLMDTPPYYPGVTWAVDMELQGGGYVILHQEGAIWSSDAGWTMTTPPYYSGIPYARDLEFVGNRYFILHRHGAIYHSLTGWIATTPPFYPWVDWVVDLEVR